MILFPSAVLSFTFWFTFWKIKIPSQLLIAWRVILICTCLCTLVVLSLCVCMCAYLCWNEFSYVWEGRWTSALNHLLARLFKDVLYVSVCLVAFACHCSSLIVFLSRLLAQLPEENVTLLCLLFGVLHKIHTHSEVNQMTATNLALCIAPNMLWRSSQISPDKEGQSVLRVNQHTIPYHFFNRIPYSMSK